MASYNHCTLVGNVTRDIEVKFTQSGTAVAQVGLAVNDKRKNAQGEWIDEVSYIDITLFGKTAELAGEYLSKGSSVLFGGRLKMDSWEKDGKKNYKLHVIGETMQFLGGKGSGGSGDGPRRTNTESQAPQQRQQNNRQESRPQQQQQEEEIPF